VSRFLPTLSSSPDRAGPGQPHLNGIQAIDSAEPARREIAITVDGGQGNVEVGVRDSGPGLPASVQTPLFDLFATDNEADLGMGLAIGRDIVENHGGQLCADPNVPTGEIFRFTLPPPQPEAAGLQRNTTGIFAADPLPYAIL
jgi:signal transduction histidine kinase